MRYEALYERMVEGIKTNAFRRHDVRQRFRSVLDLPIQSCNPAQLEPALIARWQMMRLLYHRRFLHTFYVRSCQRVDEFHEACLVRITNGGLAIWLHPVGMLEPQVVVNLLPKLGVGLDLVKHGSWLVKDPAEWSARVAGASTRQQPSERARQEETHLSAVCATLG